MKNVVRIDANLQEIGNDEGVPIHLYAREDVPVEAKAVAEARKLARLTHDICALKATGYLTPDAALERIVLTPDLHRGDGGGIPIGTSLASRELIIPKAVGSDICCGMRFAMTDVTREEFEACGANLDRRLRQVFFEGRRDIAMTDVQRRGMFVDGLPGLLRTGALPASPAEQDFRRVHNKGAFDTAGVDPNLDDFVLGSGGASRDDQIGSIGGGNHFVELQLVERIVERQTAYRWGLRKDCVAIMAHSGSVSIGARIAQAFAARARTAWPRDVAHPVNGFFMLPTAGPHSATGRDYLSAMGNAANFAVANRYHLVMMAAQALAKSLGREIDLTLVYDAPHNLIWPGDDSSWLHRKGACPAGCDVSDPEFPDGHPVIVPGSMGTASWLLRGQGNVASLCSSAHGAGRIKPRGRARRNRESELSELRVVTSIDRQGLRADIARDVTSGLLEEAPSCYKAPGPVIDTLTGAGIAAAVARMRPLVTVKG